MATTVSVLHEGIILQSYNYDVTIYSMNHYLQLTKAEKKISAAVCFSQISTTSSTHAIFGFYCFLTEMTGSHTHIVIFH